MFYGEGYEDFGAARRRSRCNNNLCLYRAGGSPIDPCTTSSGRSVWSPTTLPLPQAVIRSTGRDRPGHSAVNGALTNVLERFLDHFSSAATGVVDIG
jgi:hypothetical protein